MIVDLHHAETHLSELIAAAEAGEEVVIAAEGRKPVQLVVTAPGISGARQFGRLRDKIKLPDNWEADWDRMGEELTILMNDAPLTTDGD